MGEPVFDFDRAPALVTTEVLFGDDLRERTVAVDDPTCWVELVVASGRRFMWAWSEDHFQHAEEALEWLTRMRT